MGDTGRAPFAALPVLATAALATLGLLLVAQAHGFHRDELYFIVAGRHPDFGYPDQPPLTPLLSAAMVAIVGLEPLAVRLLPAISVGVVVTLTGLMARDMGGGGRAQVMAAVTVALSGLLAAGHLGSTATYELLLWTVLLWVVVKLLDGLDPRFWLVVGGIAGVALQNKQTALLLGAGLVVGLLLARRWDVLRSPWPWTGAVLAVAIWAPNLAWQAANGFPQLEMAAAISERAGDERAMILPELLILAGPLLFPVTLAGLWWLLRRDASRPWRTLPIAFVASLVLIVLSGGKSYYAAAWFGPLMAAGGIVADGWLARGRRTLRTAVYAGATALSGLLVVVLTLPVIPPGTLAQTPLPEIYAETAEQVGWPELVATVDAVARGLDADERAAAVVFTSNYGEAAALTLLADGLPAAYSGHNGFGRWGPPPEDATIAIVVERRSPVGFGDCSREATVDNGVDLQNEEQGAGVWVCRGRSDTWAALWPGLRHLD